MNKMSLAQTRDFFKSHDSEDIVGHSCDDTCCPLQQALAKINEFECLVGHYEYHISDQEFVLPAWAITFVKSIDNEWASCANITAGEALRVLDESVKENTP